VGQGILIIKASYSHSVQDINGACKNVCKGWWIQKFELCHVIRSFIIDELRALLLDCRIYYNMGRTNTSCQSICRV